MSRKSTLKLILWNSMVILIYSGCIVNVPSFYGSPMYGRTNPYIAKPLISDSIKSAMYGGISASAGMANILYTDQISAYSAHWYQVHELSHFHLYYGGEFTMGNYAVSTFYYQYNSNPQYPFKDTSILYVNGVQKFFGNLGLSGGADYSLSFGKSEWRIIGLDLSLNHEFGSYLAFRKSLKDTSILVTDNHSFLPTLGISQELTFHTRHGSFGFKFESGVALGNQSFLNQIHYPNLPTQSPNSYAPFSFLDLSLQYTNRQWTGFIQEESGTFEFSVMGGLIYRFSSLKK